MKLYFYFIFIILLPFFSDAQSNRQYEIGLPLIRNYPPKEYKGFSQNWGFVQDQRGVLYFANGDGVLEYDGVHWRVIKISNDYTVSSVTIDNQDRVYVGSTSEFGYLAPTKNGELKYVSLIGKFSEKDKKFNYILKLLPVNGSIYFITGEKLFRWSNNNIKTWKLKRPCSCIKFGKSIIVWQKNVGLKSVLNDTLINLKGGEYFADMSVQNILPYKNNRMLVVTRDSGLYLMSDPFKLHKNQYPVIVKFFNQADYFFQANQLLYSTELSNGYYAFASMRGGTAIMDSKGMLVQILDKAAGLQNETHNAVGQDRQNSLWLSMDNGITRADISSPLSFWNDDMGLKGSVLSVIRFKDKIYAGTWQGLFYHSYTPESFYSEDGAITSISRFETLNGIKSTTWDMIVVKNEKDRSKDKLLVAASGGVYEVDLYSAKLISSGTSYRFFRSEMDPSKVFVGTDEGIRCISINYKGDEIIFSNEGLLKGFDEKIVNFGEDREGRLWITTEFSGIYMLEFKKRIGKQISLPLNSVSSYKFSHFDTTSGAPSVYSTIYKIKNKLVFISEDGFYYPVEKTKANNISEFHFVRDNTFISDIQNGSAFINYLVEDKKGNLWIQLTDKDLGKKILIEAKYKKDGSYEIKSNPFKQIPQMEMYSIFPESDNVTWFGGDDGLVKYDGNTNFEYNQESRTLIRKVILERDSVLFWGTYYKTVSDSGECAGLDTLQLDELKPEISFAFNSLTFEYASPSYFDESSKLYKIYLEGFDKKWSEWTNETKKEYTNLPPGSYKFHVVSKNIFDAVSAEAVYEFEILPPWYRTWIAYIIYVMGFAFIIYSAIRFSNRRLRDAKIKLEEVVKDRTSEINRQKKEIEKEKEKSDKLLLNILPFKIAEELKVNGHAKTKFFDQVSVMFSDFKDFTVIAQQLEPQDLIAELNRCFVFFDDVCVRHNIEKIKTIGDSFMCAGGIPIKNKTNPVDVVLAAFEMRDFISRLKKEQSEKGKTLWKIRIGINTGPIISGVVGKKKFAYDIWGDTVNTASRLEQSSFPNKINISEDTYGYVKDFFECTYRGKIPVKHKGEIDMYFAERIKKELCVDDEGRIPNQIFWELYEKLNQ
jgi:class 3 adenylate cyclase